MRRSKHCREGARVTERWYDINVNPRLTQRDYQILRTIHDLRLATSSQLARVFWAGRSRAQALCNRRLRVLYDLHCIDRFFPFASVGSTQQHVTLGRAGARALTLDGWKAMDSLPITYRHTVMVSEYRVSAWERGFDWGTAEYRIGPLIADIYYGAGIAVEIDTGSQSQAIIREKAMKYRRTGIPILVVITGGSSDRLRLIADTLSGSPTQMLGAKAGRLPDLLNELRKKILPQRLTYVIQ